MGHAIHPNTLAALTIWQEARGEPFEGMVAVAQVISNRMTRKYSSDGTVAGTVLVPYQFSGWNTEAIARLDSLKLDDESPAFMECMRAWMQVTPIQGLLFPAVLYHASSMTEYPRWASADSVHKIAEVGGHIFYDDRNE